MPGDNIIIPGQAAKLKTYNLTVEVKSDTTKLQLNTPLAPMAGANVRIFRKLNRVKNEVPLIIDYEGQRLTSQTLSSKGEFKDVAFLRTTENDKGIVRFENLVRHNYAPDYFIDISTRNFDTADTTYENTLYNYRDVFAEIPVVQQKQCHAIVLRPCVVQPSVYRARRDSPSVSYGTPSA
jgi:hypothetical protein